MEDIMPMVHVYIIRFTKGDDRKAGVWPTCEETMAVNFPTIMKTSNLLIQKVQQIPLS